MLRPGFTIKRYETKGLRYDTDLGNQLLLRIRLNKDENGITRTPVTPLLTARLVDLGSCKIPRARQFEPRKIESCFANPVNDTGESRLTTFVPYKPLDDINHKAHIRELRDYPNTLSIQYFGEGAKKR